LKFGKQPTLRQLCNYEHFNIQEIQNFNLFTLCYNFTAMKYQSTFANNNDNDNDDPRIVGRSFAG